MKPPPGEETEQPPSSAARRMRDAHRLPPPLGEGKDGAVFGTAFAFYTRSLHSLRSVGMTKGKISRARQVSPCLTKFCFINLKQNL